jgi:hypothetical protein
MTAIHDRKHADTSALARPLRLQETIAELILEAMTILRRKQSRRDGSQMAHPRGYRA